MRDRHRSVRLVLAAFAILGLTLLVEARPASAQSADLSVTKTDSPDPVVAGANLTYTITVTNAGPSNASNVSLTDSVPANTTFVSAMQTSGPAFTLTAPAVGGTGTVAAVVVTLAAGASATFTIVVNVNASALQGSTLTNTATIASTTSDPTPGNNSDTETTAVNAQADLSVTKTDSPDPVVAGANLTYTITVTNAGPSNAASASLTDNVPAGTTFVSAIQTSGPAFTLTKPPAGGTGTVTATASTLAAGATATFTLVVKVNANVASGGTLANTATISSTTTDPNLANNTDTETTSVITRADLSVTKTDTPDPIGAGNNLTYTLTVTNNGPSDAQNLTLSDAVPANTTFSSFSAPGGWALVVSGGTGTATATRATLAPGLNQVFTLVVNVNAGAAHGSTITNTASISSTTVDPSPGNNSDTETTTVRNGADLAVTKTDRPDSVAPGSNVTYTLTVTNTGPKTAPNVALTDPIPANTTFVSLTQNAGPAFTLTTPPAGGTGSVTATAANLASGASAVFTLVVNVNATTPRGTMIANTASATTTETDPVAANNTATARTAVKVVVTAPGPGGGPHVRGFGPTGVPTPTSFFAYASSFTGGVFDAVGSLSGSGPAQIVLGPGAGGGPHVRAFNPDNTDTGLSFFAYVASFTGGVRVATGDVNGDGTAEIITATGPGGGPHVKVWTVAGTTATLLAEFFAFLPGFTGGVFVAAGDLDGDGRAEIVTGAGEGGGPHVRIWSVNGSAVSEAFGFFPYAPAFAGGVRVAAADVSGDGRADVVTAPGPGGGPHILVFDGAQLALGQVVPVKSFLAFAPGFAGGVHVAAGDLNGDGKAEIVVGAGPGGGPHVRILDGDTLAEHASFFPYAPAFTGGVVVGVGP